jgi:spore coat protein U-like protein
MTRFVLALCCALVHLSASAQFVARPRAAKPPAGGSCGSSQGATCQLNAQVFDFGRGQMSSIAPAINGNNTISVTCVKSPSAPDVQVDFHLSALPAEPNRFMRDSTLQYLRYFLFVDAARTRPWGDGVSPTFTFDGTLTLDNRNPSRTLPLIVYGQVPGGQTGTPPGQWLGAVSTRLEYQVTCF